MSISNKYKDVVDFFQGKPNAKGKELFNFWFAEKVKEEIQQKNESQVLRNNILDAINNKIENNISKSNKYLRINQISRIVASLIILLGASYLIWQIINTNSVTNQVLISTLPGEFHNVELPDGTMVHLNAASP